MPIHVYDTLIVGAGFTGIGAAIKLTKAGVDDVVIVDRSDRVGGTWRDNTYPGAACDVPSLLYSFSFVTNPTWSRAYSPADEICRHIEDMVDDFGLEPKIQFGVEVNGLAFDEAEGIWTVKAKGKRSNAFHARTVVLASGPLPDHGWPAIRGLQTYEGHKIHSAHWDHDYDFTGKRVAVVGTGASAVQIVPELVKQAEFVKVFQRTPGWVLPRLDVATPAAAQDVFTKVPAAQQLARQALFWGHEISATALVWDTPLTGLVARLAKAHLHRQVKDPWLRRQLTPDFTPGCKRMLISSDYYPALQRDNCKLVDWPIATVSPVGIRTSDGIEHHLDCIVFATGYDVHLTGPPYPVTGLGGRSLSEEWASGAQAYKSINVHGYPNLFFMTGPNSGPGHNSLLVYVEGQLDYAVRGITAVLGENLRYLDVRADVQRRYNARIQKRLTKTTWMSGCSSWYLTADGFNATMYPGFATQYLRQMRDFRFADYEAVARDAHADIGTPIRA
jgi:cation diffusion facilitator CzcD-associated flavoprotein CzcO